MDLIDVSLKAKELLYSLCTKKGFLASTERRTNYRRIWARDGVFMGIIGLMLEDKKLQKTFYQHLKTLKDFQDSTGRIASNIDIENGHVSYGTLVGKIDASLWYIIGVCEFCRIEKNKKKEFEESVKKALDYLKAVELNGKDLLFIPTGGDWADEFLSHGYILFDQLLYLRSLRNAREIFFKKNNAIKDKIKRLEKLIELNYLPARDKIKYKEVYHKRVYKKMVHEFKKKYAVPYFSSNGFGNYLDSFANSLLILEKFVPNKKKNEIIAEIKELTKKQKVKICPAFWPIVGKRSKKWDALHSNALFEFRNKPGHYHNGGLWPMVFGVVIYSLKETEGKEVAEQMLENFKEAMVKDKSQFHEYFSSNSGEPNGVKGLGFSAAGFLLAFAACNSSRRLFNDSCD